MLNDTFRRTPARAHRLHGVAIHRASATSRWSANEDRDEFMTREVPAIYDYRRQLHKDRIIKKVCLPYDRLLAHITDSVSKSNAIHNNWIANWL